MSGQPRFCTTCGAGLAEGTRFCTACGNEVVAMAASTAAAPPVPPAAAAPPTPPMPVAAPVTASAGAETIVSMIPNAMLRAGFMGAKTKPYILVFTQRRVVFARVTNDMLKQAVADARDGAKSEGKGFFGQWGAQLTAYSDLANSYLAMSPDQILAQTPDNFAVDRSTVTKVKLKTGYTDEHGSDTSDRLIMKTSGKDYTIVLNGGVSSAKQALIAAGML